MAKTRLVTAIVAAGVIAAGVPAGIAWAGGPDGAVEDTDISQAVGTGTFIGEIDGFTALAPTNEEASAEVLAACNAAGGVDCTVDEVTNDNLCIVSAGDPDTGEVAGGAGPTVEAAFADAAARAATTDLPFGPTAVVIISACP
jgi:predicted small secreted protein